MFVGRRRGGEVWDAMLDAGRPHGLVPVGLGARDTLRLEAGMPLYGNELDRRTNPFEAGLGRVVKLGKPGRLHGPRRRSRRWPATAPRGDSSASSCASAASPATAIRCSPTARPTGVVTSGTMSPTLGAADRDGVRRHRRMPNPVRCWQSRSAAPRVAAEVVPLPFYKRPA